MMQFIDIRCLNNIPTNNSIISIELTKCMKSDNEMFLKKAQEHHSNKFGYIEKYEHKIYYDSLFE